MEHDGPVALVLKGHKALTELETTPRDYGTGELLYASEIHTLECIADAPGINLTTIAARLDISKSAVSKFVARAIASGHVEKSRAPDNAKEVNFTVTEAGSLAVRGHREFRKRAFGPLFEIEARLSPAQARAITAFLTELLSAL